MVKSAQPAQGRVAILLSLLGLLLVAIFSLTVPTAVASSGTGTLAASDAGQAVADSGAAASMINGRGTNIRNWPWQVALAAGGPRSRGISATNRAFCGGSLIAPDLVVTAAHCVADLEPRQVRQIEVISGRTWLSSRKGSSSYVKKRILPYSPSGAPLFVDNGRRPWWDVALLKLRNRVPGQPIKLAGPTETASFAPGAPVKATGWGVTNPFGQTSSNVLRLISQVILPDPVCGRENGRGYSPKTMLCLGGPAANTSTCFGDSGGPLVARMSSGWRLIGLTSFGDADCDPAVPSVDTRVSGQAIRSWVRRVSLRVSGSDPVGRDGISRPKPVWCSVPRLRGRTVPQSRAALKRAGCELGKVRRERSRFGPAGRVDTASLPPGWLALEGTRIDIWINR
jgi:secreted trypsin-like serine protease